MALPEQRGEVHAGGGRILVTASAEAGEALVRVVDSGVGLSPEQAALLFQPFQQVHDASAAKGTGLGLFICKGIVEGHGGRVWAESPGPGLGSTFGFGVPMVSAATSDADTLESPRQSRQDSS